VGRGTAHKDGGNWTEWRWRFRIAGWFTRKPSTSTNSGTLVQQKLPLREKSARRGKDKRLEKVFQTPSSNIISSVNFVRAEEAALRVESVHVENGRLKSISERIWAAFRFRKRGVAGFKDDSASVFWTPVS
jgi:hypothetical protein